LKGRGTTTMETKYLFGDSDVAAQRLELLARTFADSSRAFLADAAAGARIDLAIDLGCGPGFTTHLIAGTLRCGRVIGLDASAHFIELARITASGGVSFELHDVCSVPFPAGPADLLFCRFLLTHLQNPAEVAAKWATQLNPGGLLMVEEVEAIRTDHPVFAAYVRIVEAMLASQGNRLYAGPILAALGSPDGLRAVLNDLRRVPVKNAEAARLFAMNMQAWKDGEFVRAHYAQATMRELEGTLNEIAVDESAAAQIEWTMRRSVFRR
jgi:trans-aconitate 2-methyltransferase